MSTTVTTSTVIELAGLALGATLGGIAVIALIVFLVQRELAASAGPRPRRFARNLLVAIGPLVVAFVAIVIGHLRVIF